MEAAYQAFINKTPVAFTLIVPYYPLLIFALSYAIVQCNSS
jgi:hypothetical protein